MENYFKTLLGFGIFLYLRHEKSHVLLNYGSYHFITHPPLSGFMGCFSVAYLSKLVL